MAQRLFNTLSGRKEDFEPLEKKKIRMYVCGVTVYDDCHIGHARSAIIFDTIYRYFLWRNYDVVFVKNFTDIDDKIINRAKRENLSWQEVAEKYIRSYKEDMEKLNVLKPTIEPRATEHIPEMIDIIERLLRKGHAYQVDGDVYFSVDSFKEYGSLSKRSLEDMLAGYRVEPDEKKRNPLDFALWKAHKEGEPFFESPFGKGRPGWHIECSAMSVKYLGIPFDIHGGGQDLIFPHHENEKAQSEAAYGEQFVKYWIHHGFLNLRSEKMSKSLGNILLIKDFLERHNPEVLRLFFLSVHYRNPIDYTEEIVLEWENVLRRMYYTLMRVKEFRSEFEGREEPFGAVDELKEKFLKSMEDDFNTPAALSSIFELQRLVNRMLDSRDETSSKYLAYASETMIMLSNVLGLLNFDPYAFENEEKMRHLRKIGIDLGYVESKIRERDELRRAKEYKKADMIREELLEKGIVLLDTREGTFWRLK